MSSEQGLILSHASLTKPSALTLDQMCVFPISEKTLVWPRQPEVWNDFHLHRGNFPLIIFQQRRILRFNSPIFLKTVLGYFHILKTDF